MSKNSNSIYKRSKSFIEKSKIVHNNKYDYSNLNYNNVDEKVEIICPIHGSFIQSPRTHLYKRGGCNKCAVDRSKLVNTKTLEQFIDESQLIHNNKYDYSRVDYINAHTPVDIVCPIHGLFSQIASLHSVKGHGCKKCVKNTIPRLA